MTALSSPNNVRRCCLRVHLWTHRGCLGDIVRRGRGLRISIVVITTLFLIQLSASPYLIHATHDANLLLGVLNWRHPKHGFIYKKVEGTFLCLAIDTTVLASPVKMEAAAPTESHPNPVAFPHIFGPLTPVSCVTRQMEVVRDPTDGTFLSIAGLCG